jgi:hypothetical protein
LVPSNREGASTARSEPEPFDEPDPDPFSTLY